KPSNSNPSYDVLNKLNVIFTTVINPKTFKGKEFYENEIKKADTELSQIKIKEQPKKSADIEKIEAQYEIKKKETITARDNYFKLKNEMNKRFLFLVHKINKIINNVYRNLYNNNDVNIQLVIDTNVSWDDIEKDITNTTINTTTNNTRFNLSNLNIKTSDLKYTSDIDYSSLKIYAMPPNKRYTLIKNLSGGEQTMVNTTLILCLNKIKLVPFMFFDEIDSCLDTDNVKRLVQYLRNVQSAVIISHRPFVVACCNSVIGVYKIDSSNILTYKLD
ncbi:hypothetical protein EDEG_03155, partial [Edhazardia aedis USNM 41457]